ncbi:MBL fold metallo-hydrolase [Membranicola marinus]|uniref:MBL fold metallo-hydrolase n=1 Tax=Membranihabitans marinus TaxID=1227546 RepID=A0A953HY83_9BACT|nr:MBL fold metallo-hydrolase [Membranihabitans marinus]MBY5957917.1 MBL fold metallo-hydrolase [Membranihabitans marinus]
MSNIRIKKFTFNPFQENTYLLYNEKKDAYIFDPGCSTAEEENILFRFIEQNELQPVALINTHCHIDHVLGNKAVTDRYDVPFWAPDGEQAMLQAASVMADMYQIPYSPSPVPDLWIDTNHSIRLDGEAWELILAPGHSPASMVFYVPSAGIAIAGDVLFRDSIGRTDLPGGNHEELLTNIREKLYVLPDETIVYPGHGEETTIGYEKKNNPFVQG